jgi:hypothetical protein
MPRLSAYVVSSRHDQGMNPVSCNGNCRASIRRGPHFRAAFSTLRSGSRTLAQLVLAGALAFAAFPPCKHS